MKILLFSTMLLVNLTLLQRSWGVTPAPLATATPRQLAALQADDRLRDWRVTPWVQSEKPYQKIRQQVDAAIKRGEAPATMLKAFQPKGEAMHQAQPLYRWAYIAYQAYLASKPRNVNLVLTPLAYMDYNVRPQAYSWARLEFLLTTLSPVYDSKDLRGVALRLYKRNPNDVEVRYKLIGMLAMTDNIHDCDLSIKMAQQEVNKAPWNVQWRRSLAFAYKSAWLTKTEPKYAQAAKQQYQKLLTMYPRKSEDWVEAKQILISLQVRTNPDGTYRKSTVEEYRAALQRAGVDFKKHNG